MIGYEIMVTYAKLPMSFSLNGTFPCGEQGGVWDCRFKTHWVDVAYQSIKL